MNANRIRGFLLKHPKPAVVRCTTADGDTQQMSPSKSFARTAESIHAIGADLIECLDKDGALIRALRLTASDAHSDAPPIPAGIEADPSALLLSHFASLLHRAYEHSTDVAFTKMVELVERLGDRSESIESRLERQEALNRRMAQEQIDDALDRAEESAKQQGSGDLVQELAGAFLSGQMSKPAPLAQPNGKSNGAAKGNKS